MIKKGNFFRKAKRAATVCLISALGGLTLNSCQKEDFDDSTKYVNKVDVNNTKKIDFTIDSKDDANEVLANKVFEAFRSNRNGVLDITIKTNTDTLNLDGNGLFGLETLAIEKNSNGFSNFEIYEGTDLVGLVSIDLNGMTARVLNFYGGGISSETHLEAAESLKKMGFEVNIKLSEMLPNAKGATFDTRSIFMENQIRSGKGCK